MTNFGNLMISSKVFDFLSLSRKHYNLCKCTDKFTQDDLHIYRNV